MPSTTLFSAIQLLLAFIGTGIAGALYYENRTNIALPCTSTGGCELVNASHWSHINGIPVSLIGVCGYVALALLAVVKLNATGAALARSIRWLMLAMTAGAAAFSWYLQYVAAVFIGAFCIWCRSSAITISLLLAVTAVEIIRSAHRVDTGTGASVIADSAQKAS